jgi:thiamine kinase-like enzyme
MTEDGYVMEYIEGKPLWKVPWSIAINDSLVEVLKDIHSYRTVEVSREYFLKQVILETVVKIRRRNTYTPTIPNFTLVNDMTVDDFETVIGKLEKYFNEYQRDVWEFNSIHGDMNFGNILYTSDGLRIIDPRGYFGESVLIGPKEYDTAKICFSLSGYDHLYNNKVTCKIEGNSIEYSLPMTSYECSEFTKHLLVSIWLASSVFFSDEHKRAISRAQGLYIAQKLI